MGRRRQQVVHLSQMGSDGAVPQGQPILLQMEFLQQDGEGGGEGEDGQVVRKVTRQATLQTTPDGQQIIILQVCRSAVRLQLLTSLLGYRYSKSNITARALQLRLIY